MHTNFAKCSASPIHCSPDHLATIHIEMACPMVNFPIPYMGLPLSIRKVPTSALLLLVGGMELKLSTWQASMLSRGDHLTLIRPVLTAMPVHFPIAIALNQSISSVSFTGFFGLDGKRTMASTVLSIGRSDVGGF